MNVTELRSLTEWIEREVRGKEVVNAYEGLRSILEYGSQDCPPTVVSVNNHGLDS